MAGGTLGGLGVSLFFAVSGFLIARSWHADPSLPRFLAKRALRLWPALAVVVLAAALVIGPLATSLSTGAYFSNGAGHYIATNLGLDPQSRLPGVFAANLIPDVTAPLWTLPVEAKAYVLLGLLGVAGVILRPLFVVAILVALWALLVRGYDFHSGFIGHWLDAPVQVHMLMIFMGGALLYALRDRVRLDWRLGAVAALAVFATPHLPTGFRAPVWPLALPYLAAVLAYRTPAALRALTKPGDLSYGIYLWGFPIQQALIALNGGGASPLALLLAAGPLTYVVALGSWRIVERPALRLKPRGASSGRRHRDGDRGRVVGAPVGAHPARPVGEDSLVGEHA